MAEAGLAGAREVVATREMFIRPAALWVHNALNDMNGVGKSETAAAFVRHRARRRCGYCKGHRMPFKGERRSGFVAQLP